MALLRLSLFLLFSLSFQVGILPVAPAPPAAVDPPPPDAVILCFFFLSLSLSVYLLHTFSEFLFVLCNSRGARNDKRVFPFTWRKQRQELWAFVIVFGFFFLYIVITVIYIYKVGLYGLSCVHVRWGDGANNDTWHHLISSAKFFQPLFFRSDVGFRSVKPLGPHY